MPSLTVTERISIHRPIDVVRPHFMDFVHHIAKNVHRQMRFAIVEQAPGRVLLKRTVPRLGTNHVEVTSGDDGSVLQRNVGGPHVGSSNLTTFRSQGPQDTEVTVTATVPLSGLKVLLVPLLRFALRKVGRQTLREDKQDLESGYEPSTEARRIYNH